MNYEQARQRSSDGKWAWTNMRDSQIRTAGGCIVIEGDSRTLDEVIRGVPMPAAATVTHHAHDTREEAERCYWEHERGSLVVREQNPRDGNVIRLCEMPDCEQRAVRAVVIPGGFVHWDACAEHAGAPIFDALSPFVGGRSVVHS